MIQFSIAGELLELPEDFNLQFTRKNILFAFENIECERSTSFDVPATPKNNNIFKLAKWVACTGVGMRQRLPASMISGVVTKDGFLYVDSFDYKKNVYKAIFLSGDLLGLKAIKDAGEIADIIQPFNSTTWGSPVDASVGAQDWWRCIKYKQQFNGTPYPSVQVGETIRQCFTALNVQGTLPSIADSMRVIPASLSGISSEVRFTSTPKTPQSTTDTANTAAVNNDWFEVVNDIIVNDAYGIAHREYPQSWWEYYGNQQRCQLSGYKTRLALNITFGNDMPDNVAMVTEISGYDLAGTLGMRGFVGARAFSFHGEDGTFILLGNSLKNNTVSLPANTKFAFVPVDILDGEGARSQMDGYHGIAFYAPDLSTTGLPAYEYTAELKTADPEVGHDAMLLPHLPQCTLIDLLKMVANSTGTVLNYSDDAGVTFETLSDLANWRKIELDGKVLNKKQMERKFSDYGQNNWVQFDSDKFVSLLERIKINYTVNNQNLEKDKELQTIVFSEAAIGTQDGNTTYTPIMIKNPDAQETEKATLCLAGDNDTYLGRTMLAKNAFIQTLCDASTAVELDARMTLLEFSRVVPKTLFTYEGTRYVWTEAQWSKNVATLKLNKI